MARTDLKVKQKQSPFRQPPSKNNYFFTAVKYLYAQRKAYCIKDGSHVNYC